MAAAAEVAPVIVEEPLTRRPLRVGVVGLDHYHVTGWVETLEGFPAAAEIVALYDPDPALGRRLAPSHHDPSLRASLGARYRALPFETDLDELIERHALDVALVTLPNRDAPGAIARLASAGIHLIVDKPAARSARELRPAVAAVKTAGVRSVVGLTRRYSPAASAAHDLMASGALGRLIAAESTFVTSSVAVRDPANPLFDGERTGGGILSWLGVHDVDALLWLAAEPVVEVMAMTGSLGHPDLKVEDVASVAVRFTGGAVGTIHSAYALPARGYRGRLAVRGVNGSFELGLDDDLTVLTASADGRLLESRRTYPMAPAPGYGPQGRAAVADLIAAVEGRRETAAPIDILVDSLELIDAAYASARSGRRVRLEA